MKLSPLVQVLVKSIDTRYTGHGTKSERDKIRETEKTLQGQQLNRTKVNEVLETDDPPRKEDKTQ